MPVFSHLHCHTQFSLLDGAAKISSMMKKAQKDGMPAVALTDHGNMFRAFKFVAEANKYNVKPIVGKQSKSIISWAEMEAQKNRP